MSFDATALSDTITAHGPVVRVVVAEIAGSAPREAGASMLVWAGGQSGTIGGGVLEYQAARDARQMLRDGENNRVVRLPLGPALGQCCGGAVTLLSERFDQETLGPLLSQDIYARAIPGGDKAPALAVSRLVSNARARGQMPEPTLIQGWMVETIARKKQPLWIYGAGHVGRALVAVLAPLPDFAITWVDTAPERFPAPEDIAPGVTILPTPHPQKAAALAPADAHHLILTYSHVLDLELCHTLLARGFASVGLIGSKTKWARFRTRLQKLGHSPAHINAITCPIGSPDLGKHPQAIAVGVATALLKSAAQIKTNKGKPIHGDDGDRRHAVDT